MSCIVCGRALTQSFYFGSKGPYCEEHFHIAQAYTQTPKREKHKGWKALGERLKRAFLLIGGR